MALDIPVGYGLCVQTHSQPFSGQTQICTYGFQNNGAATDPNEIAELHNINWQGATGIYLASAASDSSQFTKTNVYVQQEIGLVGGEFVSNTNGTRSSQPPSPQVALICKKRTALVGRRYRGRMYLPAALLTQANVGPSGIVDAGALATIQSRCDSFLSGLSTIEYPMVLLHTHAPFTPTVVSSLQLEQLIGTQRRRVR